MAIAIRSDIKGLVQNDRVRRAVYTDPAIYQMEIERIYSGTWICLGHDSEVPQPGDFKTDELAGRPILITRDADGKVTSYYNACMHRGATVCEQESGRGCPGLFDARITGGRTAPAAIWRSSRPRRRLVRTSIALTTDFGPCHASRPIVAFSSPA